MQKSWAGWRDRARIRRHPDGVWCGFLWLFPWSPGMSSPEPALGYLPRRAGQKKRFKVTTKSMVWHSLGWCTVVLFCFAFVTFCKGTDFITGTMLYLTCARKHRKKLLLKVLTRRSTEDQLEEVLKKYWASVTWRSILWGREAFSQKNYWKFGVQHLIWKLCVFVWNVLCILVIVL